jgi:hypothetical protein
MRGEAMTKRKRWMAACLFMCLLAGAGVCGYAVVRETEPREYRAVQCGMGGEEVTAIFGRAPDGGYPGREVDGITWDLEDGGAITVLFDRHGRVAGKEWTGGRANFLDQVLGALGLAPAERHDAWTCN